MIPLATIVPDRFEQPGILLALVLIPLIVGLYIFALTRRNKRGMRFTNTGMIDAVIRKQSQWRRHLAVALSLLSLVTLAVAAAKPFAVAQIPKERATIVLVLDASQSMLSPDVKPTRLRAAQDAAVAFVKTIPAKFNVSLVKLAGSPEIVWKPSTDRQGLIRAIERLTVDDLTPMGESLATALRALEQAPKDDNNSPAPGAIVLLSDGDSNWGRAPQQLAAEAAKIEVPIYTIAFGTENGYVDLDGKREAVPVASADLEEIAAISKGKFFTAQDTGQLNQVYENVRSAVGYVPSYTEVTHIYVFYGLLFALLAALGAISLAARWP